MIVAAALVGNYEWKSRRVQQRLWRWAAETGLVRVQSKQSSAGVTMILYRKRVYLQEQPNISIYNIDCTCETCFGGIIPIFKSRLTQLYCVMSLQQDLKERLNWSRHFTPKISILSCSENENYVLEYKSMYIMHGIVANKELIKRWGQQYSVKIARKRDIFKEYIF